ncbi:hypothetical protein BC831DRAFT_487875 [Entophlyctis helioformis]|nr:hypothetical protein BC831DRAFT_487875 [Entophlyctis helioformis]
MANSDTVRQRPRTNRGDRDADKVGNALFTATTAAVASKKAWAAASTSSSVLAIVCIWLCLAAFGIHRLGSLPSARPLASTADLHFSEAAARETIRDLASDIGLRIVGTQQEDRSKQLLLNRIDAIQRMAAASPFKPAFDVMVQLAQGSHQFDFMGEPVMKVYKNTTNVIVHLSCGPECDQNALLLNAHYDTTLCTPGATDDAAGIAVMLEVLRVVSQTPKRLTNSLIFLFNGAEETLQDATHAFVTQHPLARNVRAVINLEAMGLYGKEILFQATSDVLVKAYSKAPHPHATAVANDLFATGIILSDTDFRMFAKYGGSLDSTWQNIQAGAVQHFGDNVLAMVEFVAFEETDLSVPKRADFLFYDYLGYVFVYYPRETATIYHVAISAGKVLRGLVMSIVGSVLAALTIVHLFHNPMSWFTKEWFPLAAFGGPILLGMLMFPLRERASSRMQLADPVAERRAFVGIAVFWSLFLLLTTAARLGLSLIAAFHAASLLAGLVADMALTGFSKPMRPVPVLAYLLSMLAVAPYCASAAASVMLLFVPLTGRIGVDAPVDIIVSIVTAIVVFLVQGYLAVPLVHRVSKQSAKAFGRVVVLASIAALLSFAVMHPYDQNATSGDRHVTLEWTLHGHGSSRSSALQRSQHETDRDWGSIFPISHFIANYAINVTEQSQYIPKAARPPTLTWTSSYDPVADERTIDLVGYFPGYVWPVLSFYGHVRSWLVADGSVARAGDSYHHTIRFVSGYPCNTWNMTLVLVGNETVPFEVSGIEADSFHEMTAEMHDGPRADHPGMAYRWKGRWASASILSRLEAAMPDWTTGLYMASVVSVYHI